MLTAIVIRQNFSRAYLSHLDKCNEILSQLATIHNLRFYQNHMRAIRAAIEAGDLTVLLRRFTRVNRINRE